jgi:dipeptidyl aminopeptidase/acylaminoacyl peptidase
MRLQTIASLLAVLATIAPPDLGRAQELRPQTIEDVLSLRSVGSVQISPDGSWVAFVVTERDLEANEYDADIWIVSTDGGPPRQLTQGPGYDGDPQWAPDGSWLAFRSDRDTEEDEDGTQIYGIVPHGGEAWPVTSFATSVTGFSLAPDGTWIAFLAPAEASEEEEELEKTRGRPIVADSAYAADWSRLWVAPLEDHVAGRAEQRSAADQHVTEVVWAPDSEALAWAARPSPRLRTYVAGAVFVQQGAGSTIRRVTDLPGGETPVDWTTELGLIVAGSGHERGTYNNRLWLVPVNGVEAPVSLTDGLDEHAGLVRAGAEALLVEAADRTGRRIVRVPLEGRGDDQVEPVDMGDLFASGFSASADGGRVAFVGQSPTRPPDVYAAEAGAFAPRRLTQVNPRADQLALGETRVVSWRSRADGEEIEGVLTLPVGYREGQRAPLLLRIHGGPSGVSTMSFHGDDGAYPTQVFAGRGYAVLQPNYRGSTGYGERFRGLNRGDISGRDWVDVDSGVDHLIAEGIADPDRLGVMGWSFGGHHTYWGITQTDRFKAASAGAGANELVSMFHQTDLPGFYHTYLGPSPWEDWQLYEERSAYRRVGRVTTPLLIQVGENDARVPKEQSRMFYEAMKAIGRAPVKMVTYPGQPHGVREPALQRDLMTRNVEWFGRWLPVDGPVTDGQGR